MHHCTVERSRDSRSRPRDSRSRLRDPRSRLRDPRSRSRDSRSRSRGPRSRPRDPRSRPRDPRLRPRDPGSRPRDPASRTTNRGSRTSNPSRVARSALSGAADPSWLALDPRHRRPNAPSPATNLESRPINRDAVSTGSPAVAANRRPRRRAGPRPIPSSFPPPRLLRDLPHLLARMPLQRLPIHRRHLHPRIQPKVPLPIALHHDEPLRHQPLNASPIRDGTSGARSKRSHARDFHPWTRCG